MSTPAKKYGRASLVSVEPYAPGEQLQVPGIVKLNTNESPYPPSPRVFAALEGLTTENLSRYPDPLSVELRAACAEVYGYESADWVFAGNGMDEILAMALRSFVDPGDSVVSVYPTYSLYHTLAALHGADYSEIDLDDNFQLTDAFLAARARLCFLPRPNAPSGISAPREVIENFCETFPGIVFIDEAYADFADDNCMDLPKRFDNVIVARTFSKSYGLAGLRIGTATANPALIHELLRTKDSYNLNGLSQRAATAAINDQAYMGECVAKVRATRARLSQELRSLGFTVPNSQANYVLAQWEGTPSAKNLFEALRDQHILVRYFDARRLENALRISIGTDAQINILLAALRDLLG